jgi:hypothetical protein
MAIHPLNDAEMQQAKEVSWNPAVRRLLDWYQATLNAPQHADAAPGAVAAPANPAAFAPPAAPAPAPAAVVVSLPLISLGELRKLAAFTIPQVAGLLRTGDERVQDMESLDLELLDVFQLQQYTSAIGMALTICVDLMPGAVREIYTTRGKVAELQKHMGRPGGQQTSSTHGLESAAPAPVVVPPAPAVPSNVEPLADTEKGDTMPPGPGELPPQAERAG